MFFDLLVAGVMQGDMWRNLVTWEHTLKESMPFWHLRSIAGTAIISGQLLQAYNMWMTARQPVAVEHADENTIAPAEAVAS